jgi:hypothetical protein
MKDVTIMSAYRFRDINFLPIFFVQVLVGRDLQSGGF